MILNQLDVVSRANSASTRCYSVQPPTPFSFGGGGPAKLQVQAVAGSAQLSPYVQGVQTHLQQGGVLHQASHVPQPATAFAAQSARLPSTRTTVQQDAAKLPANYARVRPQWEQQQQQLSHVPQQQQQQRQAHMQAPGHLSAQQQQQQQQQQQLQQQQQQHYQQHMHGYGAAQQQVRPAHAGQHVQQMTQLVLSCDNLLQLQAVLSIQLHQFPPSCITTAMQQLHKLRQQELSQPDSSSKGNMGPVMQAVQLQLAGQMTQALLRQLPVVSGSCLAGFLAAAASMRLVMPAPVLEQLAAHLVNKAMRLACQQYTAAPAAAASRQSAAMTNTASAAGDLQQVQGDSIDSHPQQQQQRQGPHVAALSAWALSKLKLQSDHLWGELISIAGEQLPCMSPSDCVMLAYACAKAGQHQPRLFSGLQQQLRPHASRLAPESISCLLWSYAAAGQYHQSWVSLLVGAAADKMERFSPRDMATSLWACGRLRHADPRMLSALRVQALACMSETPATSLSNLAWSLATLKVADEALTAAIISRAKQLAEGFTMQGLANVAWAVVKLQQQLRTNRAQQQPAQQDSWPGSRQPSSSGPGSAAPDQSTPRQMHKAAQELLSLLCEAAVLKVGTAKPQEVCNLLWACATLQYRHQAFLAAATARLTAVAGDLLPVDLSQALWALETLSFRHKQIHRALLLLALNKLHLFGPQALSNLTWAVASSGMHYPEGFPQAVAQQLQGMMQQMTPQGLANTLWALSKLAPVPQQLIHAASSHICAQLPMYNAQDLCNVAMATAKSGYKEAHLLQDLAAAASSAATITLRTLGRGGSIGASSTPAAGPVRALSADRLRHRQLTGQGVCNLVWAFAGTGWCDAQLTEQLLQVAMLHLLQLQPRNVAALCQGFALVGQPFDGLLTALPAAGQAQHRNKKQAGPSLQYQQHRQHLAGLQDRLGGPSTAAVWELQQQAISFVHHLAGWPADSLALVLHAMVVTQLQDRQPALVLAVLRLLNKKGIAEGFSPQRQRQLHMAFTQLALQWGMASAGQPGGMQSCSSGTPLKASLPETLQMHSSASQPSLVRQLLRDALAPQGGASCCTATEACSSCEPQQASDTVPQAQASSADEQLLGAARQATPEAPSAALEAAHDLQPPAVAEDSPVAGQSGGPDVPSLAAGLLTGGLAQLCMRSWQQHEAVRQLSRVEQEVVGVLLGMGLQPLTQHWLQLTYTTAGDQQSRRGSATQWASRALAVNVGLPAHTLGPGRCPLALCVLPPAALSSSLPRQVLGQTRLEHDCLRSAGWQVVWLSWEDWDSMAGNHAQQQELLKQLCRCRPGIVLC